MTADDSLAALKDKLNRERQAGDLNKDDRIEVNGETKTVDQATVNAGYARIWFTDGTYLNIRAGYLFTLAN